MKTLAYLDCPTGISGDMCLGALVHAGVPLSYLESELAKLEIGSEFRLKSETVQRNHQAATKVHVELLAHDHPTAHTAHSHSHSHAHSRRLPQIETLIQQADIPVRAADWSLAIFRLLAKAEATVHGIPPEKVHFHEVGATDAIVDIVGTCLGLDWLNIDEIMCSPLPTGGGTVRCEHGLLPVPAPAVLSMMATAQIPIYGTRIEKELVTPTGCAIAATLATAFGPPPRFTPQKIGLGAGGRNLALPNILRLWIGTADAEKKTHQHQHVVSKKGQKTETPGIETPGIETFRAETPGIETFRAETPKTEEIIELQTQIDDCSAQAIAHTFNLLFAAGAVDVFSQPVTMKKNRLGTLINVLCPSEAVASCETVLFRETTTLGIRRTVQKRSVLAREMMTVTTDYGDVSVKIARAHSDGAVLNVQPEYDDCAKAAQLCSVPFYRVQQAAMRGAIAVIEST